MGHAPYLKLHDHLNSTTAEADTIHRYSQPIDFDQNQHRNHLTVVSSNASVAAGHLAVVNPTIIAAIDSSQSQHQNHLVGSSPITTNAITLGHCQQKHLDC